MPDENATQPIELIPAPTIKPVVKAPVKADPTKELKAAKTALATLADDNKRLQEENCELMNQLAETRKKNEWAKSYNRAALTNVADQLTLLQRTINILMAGGEQ